jgi:hypothetical protein
MNPNSWRQVLGGTPIRQEEGSNALDAKLESPQEENDGAQYLARLKMLARTTSPSASAPVPESAPGQGSGLSQERRHSPRYKCEGSVEFRLANSDVRTWGTVTDISELGCYVEMMATSPVGSVVDMVVEVNGIRAQVRGEVRTCYPCLGMGIAFTEVEPQQKAHLRCAGKHAITRVSQKGSGTSNVTSDRSRTGDADCGNRGSWSSPGCHRPIFPDQERSDPL